MNADGTTGRREFLRAATAGVAGAGLVMNVPPSVAQEPGERPSQSPTVRTLNPRGRIPVSLIIDDSTCLANLAHFCIPQFHEVFPDRYRQPWKTLPREIPDAFVLKFAEWCHDHNVKGKYSVIPYPACVGWLDRDLPGWSRQELETSLQVVRSLERDWDFHPEMVSHTWVIDTKTGRPYPERTDRYMENWRWTDGRSVDEVADYMTYALRILHNVGVRCDGITTPGGFGNRVLPELAQATLQSCREVFKAEIPHYFRHLFTDERSVAPRVEYASGLNTSDPRCVVSIIGCTGDWFGGWDGLTPGNVDQFITEDGKGRLPEVIARGEPAILVCHWPGIYYNGEEVGFRIFQEVVRRLNATYDNLMWMKLSEIARYWAARELTRIDRAGDTVRFHAPFACPAFTVRVTARSAAPRLGVGGQETRLNQSPGVKQLGPGGFVVESEGTILCFDLPRGESSVAL